MSDFRVRKITKEDDAEYEAFLNTVSDTDPSVLAYHYPFYRDIIESCNIGEPFYTGLYKEEELIAVLPGFVKTVDSGTVYNSMPFFGPNAGVICKDENSIEQAHQLLIGFVTESVKNMPNPIGMAIYTPFLKNNNKYYTQELGDSVTIEKHTQYIYMPDAEWDGKIRYDIRKGEKSGLTISEDITPEKVNELYNIYVQNCNDYGIPIKPKQFIMALSENARNGKNVSFYFTHHENKIIGGLIVLYSKKTLSYYLPCSLDAVRTLQPVTYMINHAFRRAKDRGIDYWNWESSPDETSGVHKFKNKWGSLKSGYTIFVKPLCETEYLKNLGKEALSKAFPYFYVYPFNKLEN